MGWNSSEKGWDSSWNNGPWNGRWDYSNLWTPAQISTTIWVDASNSDSITESSNLVSKWDDLSGNDNYLEQTTGTNQPTTNSNTIGGLNAILFDGSDNFVETDGNPFAPTVSNAFVIMMIQVKALDSGSSFTLTGSELPNSERWQAAIPWSDGNLYFDVTSSSPPGRLTYGPLSDEQILMPGFYCSTTDSVQELWINGTKEASDTSGFSAPTNTEVEIGRVGSNYKNQAVGEFIAINGTITTATRQLLEGYMAWKWGQQANLPSGHPYENAAPTV